MDRARRIVRLAVVAVVAVATSGLPAVQAQEPAPTITAEPATGLVDAQRVTVSATGFPPSEWGRLAECPTAAAGVEHCQWTAYFDASSTGTFTATVAVRTIVRDPSGVETDCRGPDACVLVAFRPGATPGPFVAAARIPLHFEPDGPLAPPPSLVITPDADLVDGQTVRADGSGFVRNPGDWLLQCTAGPFSWDRCDGRTLQSVDLVDGAFSTEVRVFTLLSTAEAGVVDCRLAGCVMVTGFDESDDSATVALGFDPDGPLLPPPASP